ncbi:antibiotic biosynthesis monooxygenase [Candidatus Pelagibacter sp.]|jgi:quinol monooxygenase YgiN|nr:antibiotic biosynthesis monooxygenase [Candidatus Pelagibacter sp.]|tara:strand:- start:984 stop:1292 length:309 start_codon:yes stop_codon:yes gene_type:complete
MPKIIVFASFYPKKNKKNEVKKIILSMINPTRSEKGNEIYNFYEKKNNDDKDISFHLFEVYKDDDALDFHRKTSHYKNYRSKIIDLLKLPIDVKILNSIDSI